MKPTDKLEKESLTLPFLAIARIFLFHCYLQIFKITSLSFCLFPLLSLPSSLILSLSLSHSHFPSFDVFKREGRFEAYDRDS